MHASIEVKYDPNQLEVYSELRKGKIFVGTLTYVPKQDLFQFDYDRKYILTRGAVPVGPDIPVYKQHHESEKGELFASIADRIPSKENPAYEDYCDSQGILPTEKNLITLLTTIGRRGPSTFIFEPVPVISSNTVEELRDFRKKLNLTLREFATAFDIHLPTLSRLETEKSQDKNTLKLIAIYLHFPSPALWQLQLNGRKLHRDTRWKLIRYFQDIRTGCSQ